MAGPFSISIPYGWPWRESAYCGAELQGGVLTNLSCLLPEVFCGALAWLGTQFTKKDLRVGWGKFRVKWGEGSYWDPMMWSKLPLSAIFGTHIMRNVTPGTVWWCVVGRFCEFDWAQHYWKMHWPLSLNCINHFKFPAKISYIAYYRRHLKHFQKAKPQTWQAWYSPWYRTH
jgi:hypothetical protein